MMFAVHGPKFEDVLDDGERDSSKLLQAEMSVFKTPVA